MKTDEIKPEEIEARRLRDKLYGCRSSDMNWEGCKDSWMRAEEIEWLKRQLWLRAARAAA